MSSQAKENPVITLMKVLGVESRAELARIAGVGPAAVYQWERRGVIPARHVLNFAEMTGLPPNRLYSAPPRLRVLRLG